MSLEWTLAGLLALGHAGILVYAINVVHALGLNERRMDRVKQLLLAAVLGLTALLVWGTTRDGWSGWPWPLRLYALLCWGVGLVGIPVSSLVLHSRRLPPGLAERASQVDLAERSGASSLIGPGHHSWLLRIPGNESLRLRKREWVIEHASLPAEWDGLSVVHLTDLHFAPCFQRRFFELVADEASEWDADLVVFTGDLVDHDEALDWIVPVMSRLRGKLGTFAILGNHDFDHRPEQVLSLLEEAGFRDVEGRWTSLDVGGRSLAVGGTSYPWGPVPDLGAMPGADFRLLLSHSPDLFYRASAAGVDLMLSGHNHGGQVRLPGLGPIFMPSRYSRRFDRGYFRSGRTLLHVSQGVAGKHPVRIGCTPEISRLVLRTPTQRNPTSPNSRVVRAHGEPRAPIPAP